MLFSNIWGGGCLLIDLGFDFVVLRACCLSLGAMSLGVLVSLEEMGLFQGWRWCVFCSWLVDFDW